MATIRNADERLIILLPPELLEEVRRAAEAEDLSVSQIVRRAIRNELKAIERARKMKWTVEELQALFARSGHSLEDVKNLLWLKNNPTTAAALSELTDEPEHQIKASRAAMRTVERAKK